MGRVWTRAAWAHDDHIKVWLLGRTEQVKYPPGRVSLSPCGQSFPPQHFEAFTLGRNGTNLFISCTELYRRRNKFLARFFILAIFLTIFFDNILNNILHLQYCRAVSQVSSIASSSRDPQLCDQMKGSLIKKQVRTMSVMETMEAMEIERRE